MNNTTPRIFTRKDGEGFTFRRQQDGSYSVDFYGVWIGRVKKTRTTGAWILGRMDYDYLVGESAESRKDAAELLLYRSGNEHSIIGAVVAKHLQEAAALKAPK